MKQYRWKRTYKTKRGIIENYVIYDIESTKNKYILHNIKGVTGYHQFDLDTLAFLIKKLYE